MADKKLEFAVSGKGWQDFNKHLGIATKSLEGLKKAGYDVSKVFKSLNVDSGVTKFNKDLLQLTKSMVGVHKETKAFLQVWADQRVKEGQVHFKARLDQINSGLDRSVRLLKTVKDEATRARIISDQVSLIAKKEGMETSNQGPWTSRLTSGARALGLSVPKGLTTGKGAAFIEGAGALVGGVGTVLAAGAIIEQVTNRIYGKLAERGENRLQGQIAAKQPIIGMLSQGYRGQLGEEAFKERRGVGNYARAYAENQMDKELVRQGYYGTMMGAKTSGEAVWEDLKALRLISAWKEIGIEPQDARNIVGKQVLDAGYQGGENQYGKDILAYREAEARGQEFYQMRRLLGTELYGPGLSGSKGAIGDIVRGGFTQETAQRTLLDLVERGGARAAESGMGLSAARFQREHGIERAGSILGGLGMSGSYNQADQALLQALTIAVGKGLGGTKMKLEKESFIEASTSAAERMMSQYGGFSRADRTVSQVAASMAAMMPNAPTSLFTQAAGTAYQSANAVLSGATSPYIRSRTVAEMMPFVAGKMGASPMAFNTMRILADMDPNAITEDNPLIVGLAHNMGMSPADLARRAGRHRQKAAGSIYDFLTTGQKQGIRGPQGTLAHLKRLNDMASRAKGGGSGWYADAYRKTLAEMAPFAKGMGLAGDNIADQMAAVRAANVAEGQEILSPQQISIIEKQSKLLGPTQETNDIGVKQQVATAKGQLSMMEAMDNLAKDIEKSVVRGGDAAVKMATSFEKLSDDGLFRDFNANFSTFIGHLRNANEAMGFKNKGPADEMPKHGDKAKVGESGGKPGRRMPGH